MTHEGLTLPTTLVVPGNLSLSVAGNVINGGTIAAGGNLALQSTAGSIINGSPGATGRVISAGKDLSLQAAGNVQNYQSTITAGGSVFIASGGKQLPGLFPAAPTPARPRFPATSILLSVRNCTGP